MHLQGHQQVSFDFVGRGDDQPLAVIMQESVPFFIVTTLRCSIQLLAHKNTSPQKHTAAIVTHTNATVPFPAAFSKAWTGYKAHHRNCPLPRSMSKNLTRIARRPTRTWSEMQQAAGPTPLDC
jgi:hypothetical protein